MSELWCNVVLYWHQVLRQEQDFKQVFLSFRRKQKKCITSTTVPRFPRTLWLACQSCVLCVPASVQMKGPSAWCCFSCRKKRGSQSWSKMEIRYSGQAMASSNPLSGWHGVCPKGLLFALSLSFGKQLLFLMLDPCLYFHTDICTPPQGVWESECIWAWEKYCN